MRKWSHTSSFFSEFITHIHQKLDFLIFYRTIQRHTQPMGLIHMPAGEDTRFLPERANQSGITLEIHHTDFTFACKPQILFGDVHNDGKPLPVPHMPEHQKIRIPGEKILTGGAVVLRKITGQFRSVHGALQKSNRLLVPSSFIIQHLGGTCDERRRQRTALLGTDLNTAHAVDAEVRIGLARFVHGYGT